MRIIAKETFGRTRIIKGYSIQRLARTMGVNPSVVFNIEKRKPVRPETAKKTCEVLGLEFDQLFTVEETKNEKLKEQRGTPKACSS